MELTKLAIEPAEVSGQRDYHGAPFPLVLQCRSEQADLDATVRWVRSCHDELARQLAGHGSILFRGFPLKSAEDFDAFVAAFGYENFPYERSLSNAVRINRTQRVFTANEAPAEVAIYLHHEMAQTPIYPSKLFFFCQQAATRGGATPLCRSDILWEELRGRCPQLARACEQKGLRYTNVMPAENDLASGMGRSWQSTFRVTNQAEAEQRMSGLGYTWRWLSDGCLQATTPLLPAVRELPNGRKVFFNQLIAAFKGWKDSRNDPSKAIVFGDGTPLDPHQVQVAVDLADELSFDIPWQQGDAALVDNFLVMHGRRPFEGKRQVLASLVAVQR